MITEIAGYLSFVLGILALVPYIRDVLRGTTKPERISWLIWSVIGCIAFFSQWAKGASYSLFMPASFTLGNAIIFLLSFKYGYSNKLRLRDILALCALAISLVLWYLTREPAIALGIVILIDFIGGVLTIMKSYENPGTETVSFWILSLISAVLSVLAVGQLNAILLAFPLFIVYQTSAVTIAIKLGKRRLAQTSAAAKAK